METVSERKFGLSGSTLKLIAIITMLIDHIGAAIYEKLLWESSYFATHPSFMGLSGDQLYYLDRAHRLIGRIAFPIFCFLLVEGFFHTGNKGSYALRLFLFALIAEVPFDLAFQGQVLEFTYQNVFFTLCLGFVTIWIYDLLVKKGGWIGLLRIGVLLLSMYSATAVFSSDYGWMGILLIMIMYKFRSKPALRAVLGSALLCSSLIEYIFSNMRNLSSLYIFNFLESFASFAFIPIHFYNGQRGLNLKYVFYLFYPVHLLLLYGIYRMILS